MKKLLLAVLCLVVTGTVVPAEFKAYKECVDDCSERAHDCKVKWKKSTKFCDDTYEDCRGGCRRRYEPVGVVR